MQCVVNEWGRSCIKYWPDYSLLLLLLQSLEEPLPLLCLLNKGSLKSVKKLVPFFSSPLLCLSRLSVPCLSDITSSSTVLSSDARSSQSQIGLGTVVIRKFSSSIVVTAVANKRRLWDYLFHGEFLSLKRFTDQVIPHFCVIFLHIYANFAAVISEPGWKQLSRFLR